MKKNQIDKTRIERRYFDMDNFSYENALSKCKTLEDITGKNG